MNGIGRAGCLVLFLVASWPDRVSAQPGSEIDISGGLVTASFVMPQGKVHVHFSSDAAPGDTISGRHRGGARRSHTAGSAGQPGIAGGTRRRAGRSGDAGSSQQYVWTVPTALRSGRAALTLRSADGPAARTRYRSIPASPSPRRRLAEVGFCPATSRSDGPSSCGDSPMGCCET